MIYGMFPCAVLLTICFVVLHCERHAVSNWLRALLFIICAASLYVQTHLAHPLYMRIDKPEFTEAFPNHEREVLFHWHEMFHYYLGAKYFPEVGYFGLYESALAADKELPAPRYTTSHMRSLRNPREWIPAEEGLRRGIQEFRPLFSEARWDSFKKDLEALQELGNTDEINAAINDVGYNPPPTWANLGYIVANIVSIREADSWLGNLRPYWYQAHWIPLIDVFMLAGAMWLVWRSFGALALAAFIGLHCYSMIAQYNWTAGSFFRWTWFCALIAGLCMLKRGRYAAAGGFLAISALDRIFPVAFLIGAGLPLFWQAVRHRRAQPLLQFVKAASLVGTGWLVLSMLLFGFGAWQGFAEKILLHKELIFMHSIGYKRLAMYGPELLAPSFDVLGGWWPWNVTQQAVWKHVRWLHYPFMALLLAAAAAASLRRPAYEAAILFGGTLFFVTQMTTSYYYLYFATTAVVLLGTARTPMRNALLLGAFATIGMGWLSSHFANDEVRTYYWICNALLLFYTAWAFGRLYEAWRNKEQTA